MGWLSSTRVRLWWWRAFWVIPVLGLVVGWLLLTTADRIDASLYGSTRLETIFSTDAATALLAAIGGGRSPSPASSSPSSCSSCSSGRRSTPPAPCPTSCAPDPPR